MEDFHKHYIRIREDGCIVGGFSDAIRQPVDGDICINEHGGYQFRLFHNGEENPSLFDWNSMIPLYKWNGEVLSRTEEEVEAELAAIPVPETVPSEMDQLRADIDFLAIMTGVEL